ncbi:FAD-dependent oxidoreductase [Nocardia stercoris]|uniref:L-aspartate oxidase n=1 Tax=Nocardia stercoris TaxID=2483361 RepID=A0A3M2LEM7_9NOCA|nr:FAD-binding protein [Nocardia stercoris]RMI35033.1 FAD-dependent oxidoreductase [Nocardia stercoris]
MTPIDADVLVVGGGPAGAWAALAAAYRGASVVLVDKARCGASGPSAHGTVAFWNIPPGTQRAEQVRRTLTGGGALGDPEWIDRVLGETHRRVRDLMLAGYRFLPELSDAAPRVQLDGARYLTRLRRCLAAAGVRILDHHPALQLLIDADGVVTGAGGVRTRSPHESWTIRAGAVVVATGGCAFRSGAAGTDVDTGDGLLMAAEVGGELSGMEFSCAYTLIPGDRMAVRQVGPAPVPSLGPAVTVYDESGAAVDDQGPAGRAAVMRALADGRRIYAVLAELPEPVRRTAARFALADGRVPLRAQLDGTVRGTGGVRIVGFDCATTAPGLFAAGDVTSREAVRGASGGLGGHDGAWSLSSGVWAGAGAAEFARGRDTLGRARPAVPGAGLGPGGGIDPRAVVGLVQEHTLPLRRSYLRSAGSLCDSIAELDGLWPATQWDLGGQGAARVRAREAAALLAVARWTKHSALARPETRGMHRRTDHPGPDRDYELRLLSGGLDQVWVRPDGPDADSSQRPADLTAV